jgi:hypothetical protein
MKDRQNGIPYVNELLSLKAGHLEVGSFVDALFTDDGILIRRTHRTSF